MVIYVFVFPQTGRLSGARRGEAKDPTGMSANIDARDGATKGPLGTVCQIGMAQEIDDAGDGCPINCGWKID